MSDYLSRKRLINLAIATLLFACTVARAQGTASGSAQSFWTSFIGDIPLSQHWGVRSEINYRRADGVELPQELQLRGAAAYRPTRHLTFLLAYTYSHDQLYPDSPLTQKNGAVLQRENRLNEEVGFDHALIRGSTHWPLLMHRIRVEQRFRETCSATSATPFSYTQRLRYLLRAEVPLHRAVHLKTLPSYLVISDEVFVNVGAASAPRLLNQNRSALGAGWIINQSVAVEPTYIHQYLPVTNSIFAEHNDVVQLTVRVRFPGRSAVAASSLKK